VIPVTCIRPSNRTLIHRIPVFMKSINTFIILTSQTYLPYQQQIPVPPNCILYNKTLKLTGCVNKNRSTILEKHNDCIGFVCCWSFNIIGGAPVKLMHRYRCQAPVDNGHVYSTKQPHKAEPIQLPSSA
jgi:hypothetical protein